MDWSGLDWTKESTAQHRMRWDRISNQLFRHAEQDKKAEKQMKNGYSSRYTVIVAAISK